MHASNVPERVVERGRVLVDEGCAMQINVSDCSPRTGLSTITHLHSRQGNRLAG